MTKKRGDRFPLLVYTPLWQRWGRLGPLLMLASGLLWWLSPRVLGPTPLRPLALFPVLAGGVLFLYSLAARKMAYAQCFSTCLRIQTPIYPLIISYRRVSGTRPMQMRRLFDPQKDRAARRAWPSRYWGMTAVVLELKGFPVSKNWLRLWFDRHLFLPDGTGLVLLVEDWMGLSRQLDSFQATYRAR
ncbi:MAG TPA: hypothetical protein ENI37_05175 [Chloroflexi bacterium]|nr:hypothetical protein [Chloroflexota bacterium]